MTRPGWAEAEHNGGWVVDATGNADELLREVARGNTQALSPLLEHVSADVRRRIAGEIHRRFQSLVTVDDVMQECYVDVFLGIGGFVPHGINAFRNWVLTIARGNLRTALEGLSALKRGGDRLQIQLDTSSGSTATGGTWCVATQPTPSGRIASEESRSALKRAVEMLPEEHRRVVQLYDLDGWPIEQVCQTVHRSAGAVYMLRNRAHQALRSLLGRRSLYLSASA